MTNNWKTETFYGMEQLTPKSVEVVDSGVIGKDSDCQAANREPVSSRQYAVLKCTFEAEGSEKTYCKYYMVVSMHCLTGSFEGGAGAALQVVELPSTVSDLIGGGWSRTFSG